MRLFTLQMIFEGSWLFYFECLVRCCLLSNCFDPDELANLECFAFPVFVYKILSCMFFLLTWIINCLLNNGKQDKLYTENKYSILYMYLLERSQICG